MSMPEFPDINPKVNLKRCDSLNLLLSSIALEEMGLSHIINAEGEKIQKAVCAADCLEDLLLINKNVEKTLRTVIFKQMLLQFQLDDVLEVICRGDCDCEKCNNY